MRHTNKCFLTVHLHDLTVTLTHSNIHTDPDLLITLIEGELHLKLRLSMLCALYRKIINTV